MGITDVLTGLKNKVLDAATYELLRRNFELLEENNSQLKEKVELQKEENEQLTVENKNLLEKVREFEAREKYEIHKGIAFKANQDGVFYPTPYCPNCSLTMSDAGIGIYKCPKCGYVARPKIKADVLAQQLNSSRH